MPAPEFLLPQQLPVTLLRVERCSLSSATGGLRQRKIRKLGLSEVQVGLPLPPVILFALRRLIGARHAERLAVTGTLISPQEAALVGLVDEVVSSDRVVDRALRWCESLLALPSTAVELTRMQARADLVEAFAQQDIDEELSQVSSWWWVEETQKALHEMVQRLAMKKRA